jgi:internalin A
MQELFTLAELQEVRNSGICDLSYRRLTALPSEISQLTDLRTLRLDGNRLTALPSEIGQLTSLQMLRLDGNELTALPSEIGQLTGLRTLRLDGNDLTALPSEIGQLTSLQILRLSGNRLTALPSEIGQLASLQTLTLFENRLTALPPEVGQLTSLQMLRLEGNQLTVLPLELADQLDSGLMLEVDGNPLREPLPDLIQQGTGAVAVYLRSLYDGIAQYEAKVLLIGEGNVGKTSLSAALRDEDFVEGREFTHGIEIQPVVLPHPSAKVDMMIRLWDFGGKRYTGSPTNSFSASVLCTWWCGSRGKARSRTRSKGGCGASGSGLDWARGS